MNKVKDIKLEIPKTIAPNRKIVGFAIVKSIIIEINLIT